MREICTSGSGGGGALPGSPYLYSERHAVGCYKRVGPPFARMTMLSGPVHYFQVLHTAEVFRVIRDKCYFEGDRVRCYECVELADWQAALGQLARQLTKLCRADFVEGHDCDVLRKCIDELMESR